MCTKPFKPKPEMHVSKAENISAFCPRRDVSMPQNGLNNDSWLCE